MKDGGGNEVRQSDRRRRAIVDILRMMSIEVDTSYAPTRLRFVLDATWPTVGEHTRLRQRLIKAGQLTASTIALYDVRKAATYPGYEELQSIVNAAQPAPWPRVRAYLTLTPVQYGVVRQFQALTDGCVEIQIFTNEAEADAWYSNQRASK